eukprot:CAMPEP_0177654858 /NCGR_PEP_ID=MMETSP0447-20121125/14589_1 /TAXON_ID=0 /ORGANISM="Stygamoeba regulata, Strain BSH-02190019" /LENGTH=462 /DNA_ID=CAMNT_0019158601 /DNA_START=20 /DNA_END=1408 /DNA_ORIENTATION=+
MSSNTGCSNRARRKVVIIGALGMDFHTFNTVFRNDVSHDVLAFTVASEQNVGTTDEGAEAKRSYPPELAGPLYPNGIPMIPETHLEAFIRAHGVDEVVFAYSDVHHTEVLHKGSRALACGADYRLISPRFTQLPARKPLLAVNAVRTGCGKSQVSRLAVRFFKEKGYRVVAIREPMPYGNLLAEETMRFASYDDFQKYNSTVEEREEYEPYVEQGLVIYSGVDYEKIVRQAEAEADVIVWDGGNNEICFYRPDLMLCIADPLRPGHELEFHPGEVNARSAHVFVVNKMNSVPAGSGDAERVVANLQRVNPLAEVVYTDSIVQADQEDIVRGKRVVVVEDGPTVTHGGMAWGAGMKLARSLGAHIIDPRPFARGGIKRVLHDFTHLTEVVPAMGYSPEQLKDLEDTLNSCDCDAIVNGSPMNLSRVIAANKPVVRVTYDVCTHGQGRGLEQVFEKFVKEHLKK